MLHIKQEYRQIPGNARRVNHHSPLIHVDNSKYFIHTKTVGYSGLLKEKIEAQKLRKQGLSYGEIRKLIPVSKGTLSDWCKDIALSEQQKKRLIDNKLLGQRKGSLVAAANKRTARTLRIKDALNKAREELGDLNQRETFLIGLSLYAGEGYKGDGRIGFSNADPNLIAFMNGWFRTYFNIPNDKFRGAIWIHEGLDEAKAKQYWSSLTSIPVEQFHKSYIAKIKSESKKIRKNIHPYGVFTIVISNSEAHRRIMGWISAIFGAKITHVR